jgi:hypothetical protein
MSRIAILSLATAATVAAATLVPGSSFARGFAGGGAHFSGGAAHVTRHTGRVTFAAVRNPGHPIIPILHPGHPGHHHHWVFRGGRWITLDPVVETPVEVPVAATPAPGPCTCLTKNYTPSGLVVFADICTKESASAAVNGSADATQVPTTPVAATQVPMSAVPTTPNYAGRTYEDYLAANSQAAQPKVVNPQPDGQPSQQN